MRFEVYEPHIGGKAIFQLEEDIPQRHRWAFDSLRKQHNSKLDDGVTEYRLFQDKENNNELVRHPG